MPHFDYCSTLFCYLPKSTLKKSKTPTTTLYLDFSFKLKSKNDANNFNNLLENYGLLNFQHRLVFRMANFVHNNVINIDQAPKLLKP